MYVQTPAGLLFDEEDAPFKTRHNLAVTDPHGDEAAIVFACIALDTYATRYADRWGRGVAHDCYLGSEGWNPMVVALRCLLNGATGRLACGRVDSFIVEMARKAGFDLDMNRPAAGW